VKILSKKKVYFKLRNVFTSSFCLDQDEDEDEDELSAFWRDLYSALL
jgi:hypothetical protein